MKSPFVVPESTILDQARASDPKNSAWVSANAGSGKTHVLSQRVIRLLLDGTDPSRILCLTYTRAAAANMSNRVFATLSSWTALDDTALAARIAEIDRRAPTHDRLIRARRLFAEALETPGGLKIQTIHAFCEAILHQFPLEANVAGHFELLDNQMEAALIAEARRSMIAGAAGGNEPELAEAFADILDISGEAGLESLLGAIVRRRDDLRSFIDEVAPEPENHMPLFAAFGFTGAETAEDVLASIWPDAHFGRSLAERFADRALAAGKVKAQQFADDLLAACDAGDAEACLQALRQTFLTKKGPVYEPRAIKPILAKGVAEHFAGFEEEFARMAAAVQGALDRAALLAMLKASRSALIVADWLIARYERLKSARGFLDFNDLIRRTASLLARQDAGAWVHYKLDKGIDHILLDEAQDTSPEQWRVVKRLADEFFAGETARQVERTVFAVGDEKQSIYSFQGAEPEAFAVSGREFATHVEAAERSFERVRLSHSFRSTQDVLSAVDLVFARPETRKGLTRDIEDIRHSAIRTDAPGQVEVWPSLAPQDVEAPDDWTQAIDHTSAPAAKLAELIAKTVAGWLAKGELIPDRNRRMTAGDVMVLVRKRGSFVHALSRELKNRHVPVAGADRLVLADHIAVQDLMAIGRFALQPEDDLSLAALLKSPIFGVSEERLMELAYRRKGSLYAAIRAEAESDVELKLVRDQLQVWRDEVGFMPAFEFYGRVLGRDAARARIVARLGPEAGDVVDEFLSFCLAAERSGAAGLEAVLALLDGGGPEIKREMDQSRGEVRIMTAHASKGLEAPVVFLVDSGAAPFSDSHLPTLMPFDPPRGLWQGPGFLWRTGVETNNGFARQIAAVVREKAEEEYRRLLYVGMTRAEDRLVVCGYHGKRAPADLTWHRMVSEALNDSEHSRAEPHPVSGDEIIVYRETPRRPMAVEMIEAGPPVEAPALPATLRAPVPAPPVLPRPLAPSGVGAVIEAANEPIESQGSPIFAADAGPSRALERGSAIHRLLQSLPDVAEDEREASARRYLDRLGEGWNSQERDGMWSQIAAILGDEAFAGVFASGSRAEVSIMGRVTVGGAERAVSGKIDRLVVTDSDVLIIDYKTNRPPPRSLGDVPPGYVAQLALYRALLQPLYPNRQIRAALLFTEAPVLIHVPGEDMDASLAGIAAQAS
ncbi:double-strand break repair helicase AddA [Aliihoeflea sp. 40Bstr573]|uniref:double-strand break repair helicase AddA n=1 Tax=Aliihoeflea sp. 40Bstr573 TaxID=2696467 RepID=UPI002094CCB4|nr:double-strand break repair helicase AddA [Aliihoeflea sp. 40Bstr573]MCO6386908.1 double-strand break repair helicase AddA [Aliihoeflea sp. 40Bstr573]